ncbi:MAG TPA: hypothetical protein VI524_01465 [Anaerolineales bacterium]|nr:hypothetical protein [Anaerolineales bacterium]
MLETILKRSLFSPPFIQTGNDGPRKPHWVGNKQPAPTGQGQAPGGEGGGRPRPRRGPQGYRELASLRLGEVQDAIDLFKSQLVASPFESWVAPDYFCRFDLVRKRDGRPPVVFGRVKTCFPGDGYIQNIEVMELFFPRREGAPDVLHLHADDILQPPRGAVQSYCVRVKFLASPEDIEDFNRQEDVFLQNGFLPEFTSGYLDLLDMNEQELAGSPWLYVVGSRWFASVPESIQPEIREKLRSLIRWNRALFNYHPGRLPAEIRTLNRELGFKYGFTKTFLVEPEDPQQTARIVASTFNRMFHASLE